LIQGDIHFDVIPPDLLVYQQQVRVAEYPSYMYSR
jgi:hypothetical protein